MSGRNDRYPSLDPLLEGYLEYLSDVARKARGTVRDVRCTLRRVSQVMAWCRNVCGVAFTPARSAYILTICWTRLDEYFVLHRL